MRTIIAGSRNIHSLKAVEAAIAACGWEITTVISGGARGVDTLGEVWAANHGVPCERFLADWALYGKRAGYKRNVKMADNADALVALWDGESRGTKHMIDIAELKRLRVFVVRMLTKVA